MLNKSLISNLLAILLIAVGYVVKNDMVFTIGLFALSGALTNWLAIHMLFEKVPFLYGSGVVENRFEQFKLSIEDMMMQQFFTKENLNKFFASEFSSDDKKFDFTALINQTDFTPAYESLKGAVMESSFGGMLGMFGGEAALEPLREPFSDKIKSSMNQIVHTSTFQDSLQKALQSETMSDDIYMKINAVVKQRLDELTPKLVKEMVQSMIKEHLGWLVVWGAVFGGVIGLLSSFYI
ncbi:MAG: DUF445 domain-containing protein [Campylobacterota bacterium]|nr:DUF445 domain-containing protein [Campylobacterota bacterium]